LISSAYKTVLKLDAFKMSLIYVRNSKGPTTEPWGTPHVTLKKRFGISYFSTLKSVVQVRSK